MNTLLQLAALFGSVSEIEGRKKLQKTVHILQEFGVSFGVDFGYHHYGPFSEQLQECVQSAQHDELIHETEIKGPPTTFRFEPDKRLIKLWELLGNGKPPLWADFAIELNGKSPRELEAISTIIYLEKLRGATSKKEAIDSEFQQLKPLLSKILPEARAILDSFREKYPLEKLSA